MIEEKFKAREVQPTVLRLGPELRAELMRIAYINGRSLTKEIAVRLTESLKAAEPAAPTAYDDKRTTTKAEANDYAPDYSITEIERAVLSLFRAWSAEKQLAFLSLFR